MLTLFLFQNKLVRAEPTDYEAILGKNRLIFNNDPHRELLLFPPEDVSVCITYGINNAPLLTLMKYIRCRWRRNSIIY